MWLMMRARKLAGVLSMKLTVSRLVVGPQYFDVRTAMRAGSITSKSAAAWPNAAIIGALTGLILTAVSAAFTSSRAGRDLGVQTSCPFWGV